MNAPRHLTLRERIYEELVRMIVSGDLPSGAPIDERMLVEKLAVSRTPFREAIGTLEKEGLVEIRPYRGFFVRSFSRQEINDVYELRKRLECFAVELAVPRFSEQHLKTIGRLLDDAVEALQTRDMEAYAAHDRAFHELIAEVSGNHALIETLSRLSLQIQICRVIANESREFAERAAVERDRLLAAFRARDVASAVRLMDEHISDVQASVLGRFKD
jgi:DNA-binding GntR family transcriptional regulator